MQNLRICLTGQTGILGTTIYDACLSKDIACYGLTRNEYGNLNEASISKFLIDKRINIFIHCAQILMLKIAKKILKVVIRTIFYCVKLQLICEKLDIKFVFISSTGVYGEHKSTPYTEADEARPTTHHHMAKLHAEKSIMLISKKALVVRTGWLFGGNWNSRKNFIANRFREAVSSEGLLFANNTQRGSPTYTDDLAKSIFQLIDKDISGVVNCVNEGFATRYEYIKEIIDYCRLPVELQPVEASNFERIAKVSDNEMAANRRMSELKSVQPNWKKSLQFYLKRQQNIGKTKVQIELNMQSNKRILVIVCAYNEAPYIGSA